MAHADLGTGSAAPAGGRDSSSSSSAHPSGSGPEHGKLRRTGGARMSLAAADAAAVGWGSFLAACVGSFLAFAFIDPARLADASDVIDHMDPMTGYGLGFLLFWLVGATGAGLTWLLIRTSRRSMRQRARATHEAAERAP